jgi:serine/threonine-protein kinase
MTGPLSPSNIIDGRYEVINYIDAGGMQFVYQAYDRILKKHIALKTPKNNSAEKRFKRSAVVAAKVNHPNVAKTLDYIETDYV